MKSRILTSIRIDKIAAVDQPCQEHATMTIMKRARPVDYERVDGDACDRFTSEVSRLGADGSDNPVEEAARKDPSGHRAWLARQKNIRDRHQAIHEGRPKLNLDGSLAAKGFDAIAEAIQKRDRCSGHEALRRARQEFPGEFEKYQSEDTLVKVAPQSRVTPAAAREFDRLVGLEMAKGLSSTEAMRAARIANPEAYAAYQAA